MYFGPYFSLSYLFSSYIYIFNILEGKYNIYIYIYKLFLGYKKIFLDFICDRDTNCYSVRRK